MFPDKLRVSSFSDGVPTLCLNSGIVNPLQLHWVKGACVFWCNLPLALLHGARMDTEKESAYKVDFEEENSPAALARIQTRNLLITSPVL